MPRILAVDDQPNITRLIQVNLERLGYNVETAYNGVQALAKIKDNRPDLLVSDAMMPERDDFELLKNVRMDPRIAELPLIMLTAKTQDKDVLRGYELGVDMLPHQAVRPEGTDPIREAPPLPEWSRNRGFRYLTPFRCLAVIATVRTAALMSAAAHGGPDARAWHAVPV